MLDPDGRIASWNLGAQRIKGYSADEAIGKHFSLVYTKEDCASGKPHTALSIACAEGRYEDEGLRVRKDGSTFWANVIITGKFYYYYYYYYFITKVLLGFYFSNA